MSYQPGIYRKQGGKIFVVKGGGSAGGVIQFGEAVDSGAFLAGGGISASKVSNATAGNFLSFYLEGPATSGMYRGMYLRLYLTGAGTSTGDALRVFTTIEAAKTTATGGHISLNFGASAGSLSGLGVAMRGTLHIPDRAITLGTCAALQAEIFMDGASAVPSATSLALIRALVDGGDATARAQVKDLMCLSLPTGAYNGGNMHATTGASTAITDALRVTINGAVRYILLATTLAAS